MRALIYQGPGKKVLEERPIPETQAPTDAISLRTGTAGGFPRRTWVPCT
jgi:alcohol dehydrogenase